MGCWYSDVPGDFKEYFPPNPYYFEGTTIETGASGFAWVDIRLNTNFFPQYIYKNRAGAGTSIRDKRDVLYCPTDDWHRGVEATDLRVNLLGYQLLPGRDTGWDYNSHGLGEWAYRKKMGGSYRKAPVMVDKIQAVGTSPTALTWSANIGGKTFPTANHRGNGGISIGGNFLYEDGSVSWRKFDLGKYRTTIDIGSAAGWVVFYRPADLGPGPW